ncbi:MAG TPA: fumarylacetoacetate hydrolase family protein [Thermoanaerobaculia bacterium]|nr:fumarylacetoacetate hydrolase family protein [Thermoanaerobaculia bacterium]
MAFSNPAPASARASAPPTAAPSSLSSPSPILLGAILLAIALLAAPAPAQTAKYVRYDSGGGASWGRLEGEQIHQLDDAPWAGGEATGETVALDGARLLAPADPSKVIAVGLNYKSHLGGATAPAEPPLFAKLPSSIIGPGESIVIPPDAENVHYEAELVLVVGREAKNVSEAEALDYVFGVTAGNDVSGRAWQRGDLQWFRAKASDTFGPLGPVVATGLDPGKLQVEGRLNGETVQKESSADLLFGPAQIVSYLSRYVTLLPGDLIFTGTPGRTAALSPGDVFEVEVEGVGTLRNPVVASSR